MVAEVVWAFWLKQLFLNFALGLGGASCIPSLFVVFELGMVFSVSFPNTLGFSAFLIVCDVNFIFILIPSPWFFRPKFRYFEQAELSLYMYHLSLFGDSWASPVFSYWTFHWLFNYCFWPFGCLAVILCFLTPIVVSLTFSQTFLILFNLGWQY